MILFLVVLPIALLLLGVPVYVSLLAATLATLIFGSPIPLVAVHQIIFGSLDNFSLLAIPFFIFAGEMMGTGGISRRIIDWVMSILGRRRAGLPLTAVGACTTFGAISGSAPATVAALGPLLYAPMRDQGYSARFAAGLLTSSGAIAAIIPPSVAMILYGIAAEEPITTLFVAGILPGLLMAAIVSLYLVATDSRGAVAGERGASVLKATKEGGWALGMPILILGGIYAGVFSPTEAGGVAGIYAILVSVFVYRESSFMDVLRAAGRSAKLTAQVMLIVAAAGGYSWILTVNGVPQSLVEHLSVFAENKVAFLLFVNLLFLAIGCLLDPNSAILVLAPLLVPLAEVADVNLIHLGIIMTVNLSIGMFTPPFGLNIFVAQAILNVPPTTIYRGVLPFAVLNIVGLLLITFIPQISLVLTGQ